MLIDWFTVGAQAVNFLILVWLLKRFLYRPILHAIDEREARIHDRLAAAEARQAQANQEQETWRQKNAALDKERDALLQQARADAQTEQHRLREEARAAVQAWRTEQAESWQREQRSLRQELADRTRHEVFAIARQALAALASTTLEERMTEELVRRLHAMPETDKRRLIPDSQATATAPPAVVRSALKLSDQERASLERAVHEVLSPAMELRFTTEPDLINGIELIMNGHKVAWTIDDYLSAMEQSLGQAVVPPGAASSQPDSQPHELIT